MQSKISLRNIQFMLIVGVLVCLFVSIVDLIRFLMLPSQSYLWNLITSSNVQEYRSLLSLKQTLPEYIFISVVFGCMLSIPIGVIEFARRTNHSKYSERSGKFRLYISRVPSLVIKTLLIESVFLLEVSFMFTSHVLWIDNLQNFVFYQLLPLVSPSQASTFEMWDIYCLLLLAVVFLTALVEYFRTNSTGISFLKSMRIAALVLLSLGIQIFIFDSSEFNIRVAIILGSWGLSSFTNADLFSASLAIVFVSTLALAINQKNVSIKNPSVVSKNK